MLQHCLSRYRDQLRVLNNANELDHEKQSESMIKLHELDQNDMTGRINDIRHYSKKNH